MEKLINYCKLCTILLNPFSSGTIRPCDTPFRKSKSFIVVPCLGALCEGHSMIVSRNHYSSLLSMDQSQIDEFLCECTVLSKAWPTKSLTFAEHGASYLNNSGPCITHTHINVIPDIPYGVLSLERYGHKIIASGSFNSLPKMNDAYFMIGQNGLWFLYDIASAQPQHIRRIICSYLNLPHWDWRLFPNETIERLTLIKWSKYLSDKKHNEH